MKPRRRVEIDFSPGPTQARFLAARDPEVLFSGGYGAGKSTVGAIKSIMLAIENPGCVGLIVAPTWLMVSRLSIAAFLRWCPRELIRSYTKSERRIDLVNGSVIYFGSADKPGALEGVNAAWAWVDEARLVSEDAWRVIVGRVREGAAKRLQIIVTTTPAMGWLSEHFDGRPGRLTLRCSTAENKHIKPGTIERLRATYSPRLARSLIDGEFAVISGAVFEEFSESLHLIDFTPQRTWKTGLGVDFGYQRPAVVWWQQSPAIATIVGSRVIPPHSIVIFDEQTPENTPTARLITAIRDRAKAKGWPNPTAIYCDPAGDAHDQATGLQSVAMMRREFGEIVRFSHEPKWRDIRNGVALMQGELSPADGTDPRLYLSAALKSGGARGIVSALRGYRYPDAKEGRPVSDLPVKDGKIDHVMDATRYAVCGLARDAALYGGKPVRLVWEQ